MQLSDFHFLLLKVQMRILRLEGAGRETDTLKLIRCRGYDLNPDLLALSALLFCHLQDLLRWCWAAS